MSDEQLDLLHRSLRGELAPGERAALQRALDADDALTREAEELRRVWREAAPADPRELPEPLDLAADYAQLRRRVGLDANQTAGRPLRARRSASRRRWGLAAAAAALLVLAVVGLWPDVTGAAELITVAAEATERTVDLPDGSEVRLRRGSTLRYPARFASDARQLELAGTARFDVSSDPERPFTVATEHLDVRVLGTVFAVADAQDGGAPRVAVEEGRVRVRGGGEQVELTAREAVALTAGRLLAERDDDGNALAWARGYFVFADRPLPRAVAELARELAVPVELVGEAGAGCRVVGRYATSNEPAELLRALVEPFGLRVAPTASGFAIEGPSCD